MGRERSDPYPVGSPDRSEYCRKVWGADQSSPDRPDGGAGPHALAGNRLAENERRGPAVQNAVHRRPPSDGEGEPFVRKLLLAVILAATLAGSLAAPAFASLTWDEHAVIHTMGGH